MNAFDHVSETSDLIGTTANVVQGADQGFVRGFDPGFLPGSEVWGEIDSADVVQNVQGIETNGVGQAFNGIGAITGAIGAVAGGNAAVAPDSSIAERIIGGGNFLSGAIGMAGSLSGLGSAAAAAFPSLGLTAPSGFVGGLAQAGGAAGLGGEAFAASTWGAGAAGGAVAGTAVATGASVLGAGLAGYGFGQYGDEAFADMGLVDDPYRKNDDGSQKHKSISDICADFSVSAADEVGGADTFAGQFVGTNLAVLSAIPGGLAALASGVAAPYAAGGRAIMNAVGHHAD